MNHQHMNLNIRYDAPREVWNKVINIYMQLEGWLDFGEGGDKGAKGIPHWFSFNTSMKHVTASVEPGGLYFYALMKDEEWNVWKIKIKEIATKELGFKVGEIELGEVNY